MGFNPSFCPDNFKSISTMGVGHALGVRIGYESMSLFRPKTIDC